MFWRAIKNSQLLRAPELVLPFCIRLAPQKTFGPSETKTENTQAPNCDGNSGGRVWGQPSDREKIP